MFEGHGPSVALIEDVDCCDPLSTHTHHTHTHCVPGFPARMTEFVTNTGFGF